MFGVPKINNFGTRHHSTHLSVPKIDPFGTGSPIPGILDPGIRYQILVSGTRSWYQVSKYQNTFAREAISTTTPPSVLWPRGTKTITFMTHTAVCCNVQKTCYLLHFRYIFVVKKILKYGCLGYPKSTILLPDTTVRTYRYLDPGIGYQILVSGTKISKYLRARGPIPQYPRFSRLAPEHQNHRFYTSHPSML